MEFSADRSFLREVAVDVAALAAKFEEFAGFFVGPTGEFAVVIGVFLLVLDTLAHLLGGVLGILSSPLWRAPSRRVAGGSTARSGISSVLGN
jgi:hypothetical protein